MEKLIDRRVIKSQNAIKTAFLTMLIKDDFDEITVKNITDTANVSRKTFYLHYIDKYDLLGKIVDERLEELDIICDMKSELGFAEGTLIWFEYFDRDRDFFASLFKSNSTVLFRKQLLHFMIKQVSIKINNYNPERNTDILQQFLSMAVLGIIESWLSGELKVDIYQLSKEIGELLEKNICDSL